MFANPAFDRLRQTFADQFEADGQGFLYRRSLKGAPIRVSAAERDDFVAAFNRRLSLGYWGMMGAMVLGTGLIVLWALRTGSLPQVVLYVGVGVLLVVFIALNHWAFNAPARELEGRMPVGAERSRAEMKRIGMARLTWGGLAAAGAGGAYILLRVKDWHHPDGWDITFTALGVFCVGLTVVQAIRKVRYEMAAKSGS